MKIQARARFRNALLTVALCCVILFVLYGGRTVPPAPVHAVPAPEESKLAPRPDPLPAPPPASTEAEGEVVELAVKLVPVDATIRHLWVLPQLDMAAVWPDGRFPLPDLATTEMLRTAAMDEVEMQYLHDLLEVATEEGVVGDPEMAVASPGRAFVELEAARVRSVHEYDEIRNAWVRSHLEPGETLGGGTFGEIWLNAADRPVQDYSQVLELAAAIDARYPGQPIADYANAYTVLALHPVGMREGRDTPDMEPAAAALAAIEDPALLELAATRVARFDRWMPLPPEALDALSRAHGTTAESEMAIAEYGLDQAVAHQDWARVADWTDRYTAATDAYCPPDDQGELCVLRWDAAQAARARLSALDLTNPRSWQEALISAAWRCHLKHVDHTGLSEGTGEWTGGQWHWITWSPRTALTDCVEAMQPAVPPASEGTRVRFRIQGPSRCAGKTPGAASADAGCG